MFVPSITYKRICVNLETRAMASTVTMPRTGGAVGERERERNGSHRDGEYTMPGGWLHAAHNPLHGPRSRRHVPLRAPMLPPPFVHANRAW